MPTRESFQLTTGDLDILKFVHDYRWLHIDHLTALADRGEKALHRRLLKLSDHHFLYPIKRPLKKHLYALDREAVPVLVQNKLAPEDILQWRIRHHELSKNDIFFDHMLMVIKVHAALHLATRGGDIKLADWKHERELKDAVDAGGGECLPVRPDGFFVLQDTLRPAGQNRANFFLEADRSTTTHARFQKKIKAYWYYFLQERHTKKHGIKTFRVMTITRTQERADELCEAAAKVLPYEARKFYYFAPDTLFSLINPGPLLEDIFKTAHDPKSKQLQRLVPKIA
jgi:hypothetical protein